MSNIPETIKGMITPDLVSGLAGRLGENEGGVSKALGGALLLVFGGIINRAAILKDYPNVKLKLGGYTDSRGNAAMNKRLSAERARSVMDKVIGAGIAADRLASEGYGAEHPVASNDTPNGHQQNRRVDVRVTAK